MSVEREVHRRGMLGRCWHRTEYGGERYLRPTGIQELDDSFLDHIEQINDQSPNITDK